MFELFAKETLNTIIMTFVSSAFAFIVGGALGIVMVLIKKDGLKQNLALYRVLDWLINIFRSVPFVILMLFLMPFTKMLVSTTIGVKGTIPPLAIAAIPFVARLVENAINEVDNNLVEMAKSLGANNWQILTEVLIPESLPLLIQQGAMAMVTILSYGAMAGFTGGGGLGVVAINNGYYRNQSDMMLISIILLVIVVQIIEVIGKTASRKLNKKK
ncbi:MAG: ABC transporter permease [Clostridiaceae bacterium]|nr:ABC transporter permease [Clostridiaceae bacterium]